MFGKKNKIFWFFLILYSIFSLLLFDPKLFIGGDNVRYITLTESIIEGNGYREIYLPSEPPFKLYPPGLSILLLPIYILFGPNVILLKTIPLLCGIGSFIFMFLICKEIFKEKFLHPVLVFLFLPILIEYNHWILSEVPFLFFSLGAIYFFQKANQKKDIELYFIFSSIFASYSYLIRSVGIVLILACIFYLFYIKQYKKILFFLLIFGVFFIPWTLLNTSMPGSNTYDYWFLKKNPYVDDSPRINFDDFLKRVVYNLNFYTFEILPSTIVPCIKATIFKQGFGLLLTFLTIGGLIKRLKKLNFIELYTIFASGIIISWNEVWASERFLLPIIPIIIIYLFQAINWLSMKLRMVYLSIVIMSIFVLLNIIEFVPRAKNSIINNIAYLKGDKYAGYSIDWRRYFEMIEWIDKNITTDKIIMARKPEFVYFLSGNKSFCYPFTADTKKLKSAIKKADYILYDNFLWSGTTNRYLLPVLRQNPENYKIVHTTKKPEFYLLSVIK